jgi:hypothetical protein
VALSDLKSFLSGWLRALFISWVIDASLGDNIFAAAALRCVVAIVTGSGHHCMA